MPNATYTRDADIGTRIVSVLAMDTDGENSSLDSTAFVERGAHVGGGGHGDVYRVK